MSFTYKGLKAQLSRHVVTEDEVNRQLHRLQQQNPRIAVVTDRPTENGDEVVLDYTGFCDGEQFAGGTAEKQTLVLGSGTFIPGFEEQLLDKVWDYGYDGGTRTVDVHIQTLRAKLGDSGRMIETVRGIGYRFGGK